MFGHKARLLLGCLVAGGALMAANFGALTARAQSPVPEPGPWASANYCVGSSQHLALVAAASSYGGGLTSVAGADARATSVADALCKAGYSVRVMREATAPSLEAAASEFGAARAAAGPNTVGVFYFTGIGFSIGKRNLLVGAGSKPKMVEDAIQTSTSTRRLIDKMGATTAAPLAVFLDAQTPINLAFKTAKPNGGFAPEAPPANGVVMFAAPAFANTSREGVFSAALARVFLDTKVTDGNILAGLVRDLTMKASGSQPYMAGTFLDKASLKPSLKLASLPNKKIAKDSVGVVGKVAIPSTTGKGPTAAMSKPAPDIAESAPPGKMESKVYALKSSPPPTSAPPPVPVESREMAMSAGPDEMPPPPPSMSARSGTLPEDSAPTAASSAPPGITNVTVYFATDRKVVASKVNGVTTERFTNESVEGLYYGTALVTIPPFKKEGELPKPEWWKLEFKPDPNKHVTFKGFSRLERDPFYASLSSTVNKSAGKEVMIFVHGFNTKFDDAAMRTAQLWYDLKFDGAPVFYSWPSQGELSPLGYSKDATLSARTEPRLEYFLIEMSKRSGAKKIHLIAHSMGNKALVNALVRVAAKMTSGSAPVFNQIVLTAPDIDREVFRNLADTIKKTGSQVTMYASKNDKALAASREFNGYPRAGDASGGPLIGSSFATVDASMVNTDMFALGHSVFATEPSVIGDIQTVLKSGAAPSSRTNLIPAKDSSGKTYWILR